jgi:hypothetical protein
MSDIRKRAGMGGSENVSRETLSLGAAENLEILRIALTPTRKRGCGLDWSDDDIARAERLRLGGIGVGVIAPLLGRTEQAVRSKLSRLRIVVQPRHGKKRRKRKRRAG